MSLTKKSTFGSLPSIFDDLFESDFFAENNFSSRGNTMPAVNIREAEKEIIIEVAAPGMKKNDFEVDLQDHVLSIAAEKEENKEVHKNGIYTQREFNFRSFKRSFTLPKQIKEEGIEAKYVDGVLILKLPKSKNASAVDNRSIGIK